MTKKMTLTPEEIAAGVKLINGRKVRRGLGGALADVAEAIGKTFGPQSITQRRQKINQGVDTSGG